MEAAYTSKIRVLVSRNWGPLESSTSLALPSQQRKDKKEKHWGLIRCKISPQAQFLPSLPTRLLWYAVSFHSEITKQKDQFSRKLNNRLPVCPRRLYPEFGFHSFSKSSQQSSVYVHTLFSQLIPTRCPKQRQHKNLASSKTWPLEHKVGDCQNSQSCPTSRLPLW